MSKFSFILKKVCKHFKVGYYSKGGRNFTGRICIFHRGGGVKRARRIIDFNRRLNLYGLVCKVVYDPFRSASLALVLYENGLFSYIILSQECSKGDKIFSGVEFKKGQMKPGSAFPVFYAKPFSLISCIETRPYFGAKVARSAGLSALLMYFDDKNAVLKLSSGWYLYIPRHCMITLGTVCNVSHNSRVLRKAGTNRHWGIRPTVRGVAMNPCDHPHGGGNGKTNTPSLAVNA